MMADYDGTASLTPITVIAGGLGVGKTSIISRALSAPHGHRIGVVVNDLAEINIDAELIARAANGRSAAPPDGYTAAPPPIVRLSNGCVCCTMLDGLAAALARVLAQTPRVEAILVETSGVSAVQPVLDTIHSLAQSSSDPSLAQPYVPSSPPLTNSQPALWPPARVLPHFFYIPFPCSAASPLRPDATPARPAGCGAAGCSLQPRSASACARRCRLYERPCRFHPQNHPRRSRHQAHAHASLSPNDLMGEKLSASATTSPRSM
jgi:hypothetical protein